VVNKAIGLILSAHTGAQWCSTADRWRDPVHADVPEDQRVKAFRYTLGCS